LTILCDTQYIINNMNDHEKIIENLLQEMRRGTIVLCVLLNTVEATYGYSLVRSLQDAGMKIEQNTLYPLLRRLEKQNLLKSSWDTSDSRPRKYYTRSPEGTEVAQKLGQELDSMNEMIRKMTKKGDL
jgi:PadR family transcriptional regulator, regulatory protein PadR